MSTGAVESSRDFAGVSTFVETAPAADLLSSVLESTAVGKGEAPPLLETFLAEESAGKALAHWMGLAAAPGQWPSRQRILDRLQADIARLDALLNDQVNAILHHPRFQQLEASWRGLRYLTDQAEGVEGVKIRFLSVSWKELGRDLERAIEFDQSQLFRKVYSDEFDMPGGEPFGMLLGDYEIWPRPSAEHPHDDVATLGAVSQVAAAAFAPFVTGLNPAMFGLNDFSELDQVSNLSRTFDQLEYLKWKSLRDSDDFRFVGLTMPRVLARLPYEDDGSRRDGFRFHEEVSGPDRSKYLWGTAVYALAGVAIRSFAESGWLASISGVPRDAASGGVVTGLPVHCFSTDKSGVIPKCSTDVIVTGAQEPELSDLGFIPLCHCADTEFSAFHTTPSAQKPKKYDTMAATMNARISAMLQYILCVSRFAHYLKVLVRDKLGSFQEAADCEALLHGWLSQYVLADSNASAETKSKYPLREARVKVWENPGKAGSYLCTVHLWPHFELEGLTAALRVTTELAPSGKG